MGFLDTSNKEREYLIVEPNFTSAICYGQTGSGKTTGFMLPNIQNRIKLGHGVLVYDFKGNSHEAIKVLAKKHNKLSEVYEIGKPWGVNIDILKYASTKNLQSMFDAVSGSHQGSYWSQSAFTLFENIFFMLKSFRNAVEVARSLNDKLVALNEQTEKKYKPTLENIASFVSSAYALNRMFKNIKKEYEYLDKILKPEILENYHRKKNRQTLAKFLTYLDDMHKRYKNIGEYHNIKNDGDENSGNNGVLQVLSNTLQNIANKKFFNDDKFDIVANLLDGKIVIIDVSSFNTQMLNFLNLSIYNRLLLQAAQKQKRNDVSVFIDEAQKVLNQHSIPDVDVCRENRFEFILATQDITLLMQQIGIESTTVLLKNITSQYSFKTTSPIDAPKDTSKLKKFECMDIIKDRIHRVKPIFLSDDELFETEYIHQKVTDALGYANIKTKRAYILKYAPELESEYKTLVYFRDKNETKVVDVYFDEVLIVEHLKSIEDFNSKNKADSDNVSGFIEF